MINPIKSLIETPKENYDLRDWRIWFSNAISIVFILLLPISFLSSFSKYLTEGKYYLIVLDLVFWVYLLIRAFNPAARLFNDVIWLFVLYLLTISFFLSLGPAYARPGWLVLCSSIAAIFYGVRGAIFSTLFNAAVLFLLFYVTAGYDGEWARAHQDGIENWAMFTVNLSLVAFGASIPVGFLINRLNNSLQAERTIKYELQATNEELTAANEELEAMNEEYEAQNHELIRYSNEIEQSSEYNRVLFSESGIPMVILDPATGRFTDCNDAAIKLYGFADKNELVGLSPIDVSAPLQYDGSESRVLSAKYIAKALDSGSILFPWLHRRSDGVLWDAEVHLMKFRLRDSDVMQFTLTDITDRKRAEEESRRSQAQLVHAQKMEAVGTLAGGIAHDFNNVLGGIIGSLDLLQMLLKRENLNNAEKITSFMKTASESSKRAAEIVRQLLTLSRKRGTEMVPVNVSNSMTNVINICKNSFPKSVELFCSPIDQRIQVLADPSQIEQVLLNLCVNASHSMTIMRGQGEAQGGKIHIEGGVITADQRFTALHPEAEAERAFVYVRITDTGVGIPGENLDRIFEPFYTTKPQDEGTGLGLAITYTIVKQHKGYIDVVSQSGEGSAFTVYLPVKSDASPRRINTEEPLISGSGTILVIDDEQSVLQVTREILEQFGFTVITAGTPLDGITLFDNEYKKIDAVILDNSMPDISGPDLYLSIRRINPSVRVMLSSGYMDEELIARCRELGISEFIDKPYTVEDLARKIRSLLDRK